MRGIYKAWLKIDEVDVILKIEANSFDKSRQKILKDGYSLDDLQYIISPDGRSVYKHFDHKIYRV